MAPRPLRTALFLCPLLALSTASASAQDVPSPYRFFETRHEAGLFAGVTGQGTGTFGFGPNPGPLFGVRYGIQIGGPFGAEAAAGYSPTTRDVVDPTREEGSRIVGEADANLLTFDGRLRFSLTGDRTWRGLHPFVFLGGGAILDTAGDSEVDKLVLADDQFELGTRFLALFGGGVRWLVTERILLRGDMAVTMFQLKTPRGYLETGRDLARIGEKEWVSGTSFTLGLAYHF